MSGQLAAKTWFLAQCKPNSQRIAERNLERQGFRTFLPTHEVTIRRGSRFSQQVKPLFPGYIFVAFDLAQGGWRAINSTLGITRLVSFGNDPVPVPLDIVSQLMLRCDSRGALLPPRLLAEGDRVSVTEGPLTAFVATVERVETDRRVWVLLDFMGQKSRVAVPSHQLRRA